jgi:hypothetical protein
MRTPTQHTAERLAEALALDDAPLPEPLALSLLSPRAAAMARDEGVGGWLCARLSESLPAATLSASPAARALEGEWLQQQWLHSARLHALRLALPEDLPPPALLKGLGYTLSGLWAVGERGSSDVDLLLPEPHATALCARWRAQYGAPSLPRGGARAREHAEGAAYSEGFRVEGLLVEVHRALAPAGRWPKVGALSGEALWEGAQAALLSGERGEATEGLRARLLTPEGALAVWVAQLLKGGGALRLRDWADLRRLLRALPRAKRLERLERLERLAPLAPLLTFALARLALTPLRPLEGELVELTSLLPLEGGRRARALTALAHALPHPLCDKTPSGPLRVATRVALSAAARATGLAL